MNREGGTHIPASFFFTQLRLWRGVLAAQQQERIHRHVMDSADLPRQQHRLIETAPAQPFRMQRNRQDQISAARPDKFLTSARHQAPERFTEGDFPAVLEFLHHLAQRMDLLFFTGITCPGARGRATLPPIKTNTAGVIVAAGVGKGPAASIAQRMADRLNFIPASRAKIFAVPAINPARTAAAARRAKQTNPPLKATGQGSFSYT